MALLTCSNCGQTYNPRYMRYCARCGEGVPDERGRKPKRGPMDGGGARGGISARKRPPPAPTVAGGTAQDPPPDWAPPQSVQDMVLEYRNQLNAHPEDHATRYALGLAYCLARQWAPAVEHLSLVTEAQPEYAEGFARLAVCRAQMGDPAGAREAAQRAQQLEPGSARYLVLLQRLTEGE